LSDVQSGTQYSWQEVQQVLELKGYKKDIRKVTTAWEVDYEDDEGPARHPDLQLPEGVPQESNDEGEFDFSLSEQY
jgi:hypothetical protein